MYRVVLDQQVLFERPAKWGAVRHRCVEVGVPGVQVRVEVHERKRTVKSPKRPKVRQGHRVVAADRDEFACALADDVAHAVLDLATGFRDVERRDRHVSGIDDLHLLQRRHAEIDVIAGPQRPGGLAHGHRAEPRSRPVRGATVER